MPENIQGYTVIPIKFSSSSTTEHDLFIKEHTARSQSSNKPASRTLFVLNVPPYATEESFKRVFSAAGHVSNVIFQQKPSSGDTETVTNNRIVGFKVAYVVFKKPAALERILQLKRLEPLSTPEHPILCGMQKWVQEYNSSVLDTTKLQAEIDEFMKKFDKKVDSQKRKQKTGEEEDDDGWITVTKYGRNPGLSRKESVENKIAEKLKNGKKKKELLNFYTFQIRESKMKHLAGLRKKFEEDKKRINALKQARKFKPF